MLAAIVAVAGALKIIAHPGWRAPPSVGYSVRSYRLIGLLELAAAVGLVVGFWCTPLGVAAATGLVLLLTGRSWRMCAPKDPARAALPALACGVLAGAVIAMVVVR